MDKFMGIIKNDVLLWFGDSLNIRDLGIRQERYIVKGRLERRNI